ncbi:MAG: hypothetical protein AB1641_04825 [Thermodesulfobacteriota bacterium]
MGKVIDLTGRRNAGEGQDRNQRKEALLALIRCARCPARCARCGFQSDSAAVVTHPEPGLSFRLCPACLNEYRDLRAYLEGERKPNTPSWQNREWVRLWLAWLEYKAALENFVSSPEVLAVLSED